MGSMLMISSKYNIKVIGKMMFFMVKETYNKEESGNIRGILLTGSSKVKVP